MAHGKGKYVVGKETKPQCIYDGDWIDNQMEGDGVLTQFELQEGQNEQIVKYEGTFQKGMKHGKGVLTL